MVDLPRLGEVRLVEGVPGGTPIPFVPGFNPSSFTTFQKTVTAAGTAEQLPANVIADGITFVIKAKDGNTGKVYIGGSKADAENHAVAFELSASQGAIMNLSNTNIVWIDADVSGEGVDVITVSEYSGGGGGGGGSAPTNKPTFKVNQQTVAVPGTAVQLQVQAVPNGFQIFIRALVANNGTIYVGPDAATAQDHTKATPLEPGAFLELALTNVDAVWIDADTALDGVSWTVETT